MPKCLKCKEEISHLFLYEKIDEKRWFSLDKRGHAEADTVDVLLEGEEKVDYECPECSEVLFHNWDDAELFLQGKEN